jgi:hypothetical protein
MPSNENDPKDEMITNEDRSITNSDEQDKALQKGEQPTEQNKADDERVPTVTPDNDNGDPGPPAKGGETVTEDSSNKGKGPAGENL